MPAFQIHLTPWQPWAKREETSDDLPGVYVIAKAGPENQIYIGMTKGRDGLQGRLRAFNRSALTGKTGHAGGVTYHAMFGANVDDLLFATHSTKVIREDPAILNAYILYVERSLIWEHVELHGRMPACNLE